MEWENAHVILKKKPINRGLKKEGCDVERLNVGIKVMRKRFDLTAAAYINIAILAAIVGPGIFRVMKNLPNVTFSPGFTMFVDISHLVFILALTHFGAITFATKRTWLKQTQTIDARQR